MTDTKAKGAATKILLPVVATLASAAASYLAKKAPQYLERTGGGAGDVAHDLAERARSVVGRDDEDGGADEPRSSDELERRRRERAEHRAARRKAS